MRAIEGNETIKTEEKQEKQNRKLQK